MKYLFSVLVISITFITSAFAAPSIHCGDLPWCDSDTNLESPINFVAELIAEGIKYVAVIAVISLIVSGILYLLSGGEEEKVKRAKTWIIWSLVWVLLSVSSWYIINLINNLNIF